MMPVMIVCLLPIPNESKSEILKDGILIRPTLTVTRVSTTPTRSSFAAASSSSSSSSSSSCSSTNNGSGVSGKSCAGTGNANGDGINGSCLPLRLGRNDTTMIKDKSISSELATISIRDRREEQQHQHQKKLVATTEDSTTSASSKTAQCKTTTETKMTTPFKIQLMIHKDHGQHCININGKRVQHNPYQKMTEVLPSLPPVKAIVELHHGDVISLYKNQYQYKVHCVVPNPSQKEEKKQPIHEQQQQSVGSESESSIEVLEVKKIKPPSPPPPPPPPSLNAIQIQAQNNLLHGLKCPICFEILAEATCVNPCGHVFCQKCISLIQPTSQTQVIHRHNGVQRKTLLKITNCPTCREGIKSMTRMQMFDDLIWNVVCLNNVVFKNSGSNNKESVGGATAVNDVRSEFQDDLLCYFERSGKSKRKLTKDEKEAIFGSNATTPGEVTLPVLPSSSLRQQKKRLRFHMQNSSSSSSSGGRAERRRRRRNNHQEQAVGVESVAARRPQPAALQPVFNPARNVSTSSATSLGHISLGDPNDMIDWSTTFDHPPMTFDPPPMLPLQFQQQQQQQQQQSQQQQHTNGYSADDPIVL